LPEGRDMTAEPTKDRIAYYRERAAEARAKAETMRDLQARETMMTVAQMWESMAKTAERHSH
jgi:hypothetical protein